MWEIEAARLSSQRLCLVTPAALPPAAQLPLLRLLLRLPPPQPPPQPPPPPPPPSLS